MQNKVVRFILGIGSRSHVGTRELQDTGMLSVQDRVASLKLNHVLNIYHGICPPYMKTKFTQTYSFCNYTTRGVSNGNFHVPVIKGKANLTFYYTSIILWNSIPLHIKQTKYYYTFKKNIKNYLSGLAND